jgi:hypothetical protein
MANLGLKELENSFGKVGKKEGKGKGKDKKITKFTVAGSGIRTHTH